MPQEFTDRCMFPDHDPREDELTPDPECEVCGDDPLPGKTHCASCDPERDPTPWCHVCGSMTAKGCDCPKPFYAENH